MSAAPFWGTRYRNAKPIGVFVHAGQWFGGYAAKKALDFDFVERHAINPVESFRSSLRGQQLHGPYAVAADGSQQFERFGALGSEARAESTTDVVVFGQQILELT